MPTALHLIYEEPNPDRWFPGDRHPRQLIRRIVRGPRQPSGQERVFINLKAGLDKIGVPYRQNDYAWARRNPSAPVGIVGKPFVLDRMDWRNPMLFGASVMSHPDADPGLLNRRPIRRILVPGEWMRRMFEARWGEKVKAWPVGIDTDLWSPQPGTKKHDVLFYDKVRWDHDRYERELIGPIRAALRERGLSFAEIRYGQYYEEDFRQLLAHSRTMIFLCEHETQGLAYQQALSCGVPIFAWDRGGFWQDPEYYPGKVRFGPVSSVPYWDERCGATFVSPEGFAVGFDRFLESVRADLYSPRDYIMENLTLDKCARAYLEHWREVFG
jgi:hypothetical protein